MPIIALHSKSIGPFLGTGAYSIVSAGRNLNNAIDSEKSDEQIAQRHSSLQSDLDTGGYHYTPVKGHYGGEESSFIVHTPNSTAMNELGKKYNQDSVIHSAQGANKLQFVTGPHAGKHHAGKGYQELPDASDYYSVVNTSDGEAKKFSLNLDFDNLHDETVSKKEIAEMLIVALKKAMNKSY